jgi:putative ATP-dependent DNA ligase
MYTSGGLKSPDNIFFECPECKSSLEISFQDFVVNTLPELLNLTSSQLKNSYDRGNVKYYAQEDIYAVLIRKKIGKIESGTMICLGNEINIVRGFPKIRRTLMLSPSLEEHFPREVAIEEKMNGYNVRIAQINDKIVSFTRGGYICPYTTKKANQIMDLTDFFHENSQMVICGEMVGTDNPYVSHYYPEIGKLGFRIFDIREKNTNLPLQIWAKRKLLDKYDLPSVHLFGVYQPDEAVDEVKRIIKKLGAENREGVIIKDYKMQITPLKYTSSQAHTSELEYAFSYPFDLGRAFFFSRVIREGFQSYEMRESEEEIQRRAQRIGESILYPMLDTIKLVSHYNTAAEEVVIEVESKEEAEKFIEHLHNLGVLASIKEYKDGKAVISRLHQSTSDKIRNYLDGGLY